MPRNAPDHCMSGFRILAEGLAFPEGPVACADGSVIVTEIAAGQITRVHPNGAKEVIAETRGGPNGLAFGPDGMLYCCNNGGFAWRTLPDGRHVPAGAPDDYAGGSIQRIDPVRGTVETLYTQADDIPLRGPNDLVFDREGGFWFTDHGKSFARTRDRTGVFYAHADGSRIEETLFPLEAPNGVGLSPDGRTLYIAETTTCMLVGYDITAPGRADPRSRRVIHRPAGRKWFDSLAVEANGNICVATLGEGGITVIAPAGGEVEFRPFPDSFTTNIAFGGDAMRAAWVTLSATGRLAELPWPRPGLTLA